MRLGWFLETVFTQLTVVDRSLNVYTSNIQGTYLCSLTILLQVCACSKTTRT